MFRYIVFWGWVALTGGVLFADDHPTEPREIVVEQKFSRELTFKNQFESFVYELKMPAPIKKVLSQDIEIEVPNLSSLLIAIQSQAADSKHLQLDFHPNPGWDRSEPGRPLNSVRIEYLPLMTGADENQLHSVGCLVFKSVRTGKISLVRLDLRLERKLNYEAGKIVAALSTRASWGYPQTGTWSEFKAYNNKNLAF